VGEKGKLFEGAVASVTTNESVVALPYMYNSSRVPLGAKAVLLSPLFGSEPLPVVVDKYATERGGAAAPGIILKLIQVSNQQSLYGVPRGVEKGPGEEDRVDWRLIRRYPR
jgi:hypothetical protein